MSNVPIHKILEIPHPILQANKNKISLTNLNLKKTNKNIKFIQKNPSFKNIKNSIKSNNPLPRNNTLKTISYLTMSHVMSAMLFQFAELDTSAWYARITICVKNVKKNTNMNILFWKYVTLSKLPSKSKLTSQSTESAKMLKQNLWVRR